MKKNLIKQAKKSLSLFLAVLMLMSCWVWVAPEKAEAGNITLKTKYTVEVSWTISYRSHDGGDIQFKTLGDGWGSESSYQTALASMGNNNMTGTGNYTYSWETDNFPTVVQFNIKGGFVSSVDSTKPSRISVNYVKINGKTVFDGGTGKAAYTLGTNSFNTTGSVEVYPNYTDTDTSGTSGNLDSGYSWPRPKIVGFIDNDAAAPEINVTLNSITGSDITKTASYNIADYTCYNQYDVAIADPAAYVRDGKICEVKSTDTYVANSNNSDDMTENTDIVAAGGSSDSVTIKPNLQISDPKGSTGAATYYLVRKYVCDTGFGSEAVSKVSAKINVTYPKYPVKFNAVLDTAEITAGEDTYEQSYTPSNYHGGKITLPSKTEAEGYTFYGYWTKEQPTSGNASYNALTADFAKPCSTEDYNSYKNDGGTEKDGIVTDKDGNKWYDAGRKLDSSASTIDCDGDDDGNPFVTEWHGWWLSKDLSVKFYDVDGSFLGEKTVKAGQTQNAFTWPTSKYTTYTSGSITFSVVPGVWENYDGEVITSNSYTFMTDLILTPQLTNKVFVDKYTVTFKHPNNGSSIGVGTNGTYDYRADIRDYAETAKSRLPGTPANVNADLNYSYELLGWTSVEPVSGYYHILLEDADFDVNGKAIGLNNDWVVRDNATYYAVYRRHTKTYVVNFYFKDATGTDTVKQVKFKYGSNLVAPTESVPYNYVTKGYGYTFDKWVYYDADSADAYLGYQDALLFTKENIAISNGSLDDGDNVTPIEITAIYGEGVPTPYTVKFDYIKNEEEYSSQATVRNEQFILQTTVNALKTDEKWDDGENLYTFADQWEITEGAATKVSGGLSVAMKVGDKINTADLITLTPTSNITFKAVYANPVPFFTVTYIDGEKTFSDRVLQGSNVPAWTEKVTNDNGTPDDTSDDYEEDKDYVPADYEGEGGTYVFQGWYDEKQTDADKKQTNGNKITTENKVAGNLILYPQFKFVPDTYLIKFMSYDGKTQLAAGSYEKGQSIEMLTAEANRAAQARSADETYDYLFLGWDKPVPTFCEGHDVTFTAQYKAVYKYYDAKWYNSKLVDGKWTADKSTSEVEGETVETYLLATTHHTYNSKLYTPSVESFNCLETAPEGQNYVFAGWYYNDAEGNAVKYERGMLISGEMEFYATYTLTDKMYTVTTVVKGEEVKYSVASGEKAGIFDPQAGYVDATYHDAFAGWYTDADCTNAFDLNTAITADTKIYAKFEQSEHERTLSEVETAPTYYAVGEMISWCECSKDETKQKSDIPKLKDTKAPTGIIYLGGQSWNSEGEPAYSTDGDPISIFVNANDDIIITANDTGDVDALYNPSGAGIGVRLIKAFAFPADTVLTATNYGAAQEVATIIYEDTSTDATNVANYATKVGDIFVADLDEDGNPQLNADDSVKFKALESGKSYILYYFVYDKATADNGATTASGNLLNRKVRTAKFIYDNTAPTFEVTGSNNGAVVPTYCGTATVTGLEEDVVLTVNGAKVDVTYAEGAETGTYAINWAEGMDNVMIVATDKAGNTFSRKIKVADHSYYTDEVASTCTTDGYKKTYCLICGDIKENIPYPSNDHIMGTPEITPADCINNGYSTIKCEFCDHEVVNVFGYTEYDDDDVVYVVDADGNKVTEEIEGETYYKYYLFPAYGHDFELDENNETVYVTVTESTCKTKGSAEAVCMACDGELEGGKLTKELELNAENHEDITVTEVLPDCVNDGYYTKACSCGVTLESKTAETDPEIYKAKGHGTIEAGTAEWYVRTEPTCYQKGEKVLKCLICSNFVTADGAEVTEEIAATGNHVKTVANPDTYKTEGVVKYKCATEGCPYEYEDKVLEAEEELETYTVTFVAEDGTTKLKEVTVTEGDSLVKSQAPVAPAKASTLEYKYTFSCWTNGDETVKFPYTVTGNITLKASYKESKIMYTHKFSVPTEWASALANEIKTKEFTTLVGAYGTERVPSATPVFTHEDADEDARLKSLYTFEFKGWKDSAGNIVNDFTVKGDAEFTAYFEAIPLKHSVIYYSGKDYFATESVDAGASAPTALYVRDANGEFAIDEETNEKIALIPTKASDDANHYAFSNKWYTDSACQNEYTGAAVTDTLRLYAGFEATAHTFTVVDKDENGKALTWAATCTLAGQKTEKCSCGYIKTTEIKALGHSFTDILDADRTLEDGTVIKAGSKLCARFAECGAYELPEVQKYTVTAKEKATFTAEEDGETVTTVISQGTLSEATVVEGEGFKLTAPEKASTAEYTFTFVSWTDAEGNVVGTAKELTVENVTANATYTANYAATKRTYTVSYFEADFKTIIVSHKVVYGGNIPAAPAAPVKESTANAHFAFSGWSVELTGTVTGDLAILPVFETQAHEFVKTGSTSEATCTQAGGDIWKCSCGLEKAVGGAPATGHKFKEEVTRVEATYDAPGYIIKKCANCDETERTEIPQRQYKYINVTVKNKKGEPVEGAKVDLYRDGTWLEANYSNAAGKVTFRVGDEDYKYTVLISGVDGLEKTEYEVYGDGSVEPDFGDNADANDCGCSCHRAGFWGIVFRFFHKVISWFTGRIGCCSCPDEAY